MAAGDVTAGGEIEMASLDGRRRLATGGRLFVTEKQAVAAGSHGWRRTGEAVAGMRVVERGALSWRSEA